MTNWLINQTIDLRQGYRQPHIVPEALMVDTNILAHTWRIAVMDGGAPANLAGATVKGFFLRSDGVTVQVAGTVSGNIATVSLTGPCYAVAGRLIGSVRMVQGGASVTLATAIFQVRTLTSGDVVNPGLAYADFQIDASPKGVYANLAALNAGIPTAPDVSKIYITDDDKNWCYHNGTAWVAGGVYQSTGLSTALENRTLKAGMMVTGEISELTREAMTGAVVVSTPTNIYIYSGSTNRWCFNQITNLSIPDSGVLYADLSLSPHNVSGVVHDLQVGTISSILWTDDSKLPLLVNRWHRLSGHLLKQGITTLEKLPFLEAENTLRKDNYVVVGGLSSANMSAGVESVSISTPLSVFVYDGKGNSWRFEQQTNVVIPSNYGLFADVSVPSTIGEDAYPMSVMSLSSANWANEKLLPMVVFYYGRLGGYLAKSATGESVGNPGLCRVLNGTDGVVDIAWYSGNSGNQLAVMFAKLVDTSINQDVYHLYDPRILNAYSSMIARLGPIAMEWEGVIHEDGDSDFVGGYHGSEVQTDAILMIDGRKVDFGDGTTSHAKSVRLIVKSNVMSRLAGTVMAKRIKDIEITAGTMRIKNRFVFERQTQISLAYMCMASLHRNDSGVAIAHHGMMDDLYTPNDISTPAGGADVKTWRPGVRTAWTWSDAFSLEASYIPRVEDPSAKAIIHVYDAASNNNKIYFMDCADKTFYAGDVLEGESYYRLAIP